MITKCKQCGVLFDANREQTICMDCFYKNSTLTIIAFPLPKPKKPKKK